ncbi:hypothetical protein ABT299_03490 [Spirillospora sp. NPDC000708]|uniref:hypothetical protein n=1 Tax=Actinomadura nitritigenes TaxID=134602 RepID=UPI00334C494B
MPEQVAGSGHATAESRTETESHRLQDVLAVLAFTLGIAALVLGGGVPSAHFVGLVVGIIGLPLALVSQMISATTNERWLNVIGMVGSFVGAGFAISHGGFSL